MRFEPVAFVAQNQDFETTPTGSDNPYVDALRPPTIDLPQRFGPSAYARVDAGQSHVRLDLRHFAVGLSTENVMWGPAVRQPLLFGANAPGFPHVFLGTSAPAITALGRWQGQLLYGRLNRTEYAPPRLGNAARTEDAARLGAGFVVGWLPPSGRGLELGIARFYHKEWPDKPSAFITAPFGSLLQDDEFAGTGGADNQLLSLFARVRAEGAGVEAFGEFGKNDRNSDARDFLLEPEHNSAVSFGLLKTLGSVSAGTYWSARVELVNGRITALSRIRGQSTFYDHAVITEGHTHLGQLLGSPLLERTGGFELALDRWSPEGRTGLVLTQRLMPAVIGEGATAESARSQWALEMNRTRTLGNSDISWRAGGLFDLNRAARQDVASLFAGLSWRGSR